MRFSELIGKISTASGRGTVLETRVGSDPDVLRVAEDSRKVREGDLFVARSGTKTSGAQFAADAITRGAVAIVSSEPLDLPPHIPFCHVQNANLALALLAHEIAGQPTRGMKMIAITGTKGKTTIAYLLRSILRAAGHSCGLIGTVQIDDGRQVVEAEMTTPGAVELVEWFSRMKANGVGYCVMETSSHALHQQRLAGISFAVGMFTNLTGDHLDYHKTMDDYAAAKAILFEELAPGSVAVINADDKYAARMARDCRVKIVRYGLAGSTLQWSADIDSITSAGMDLLVRGPEGFQQRFRSPLVGRHNAYNTLCAIAGAHALGIPTDKIFEGLRAMQGVPGRLQPVVPAGWSRDSMRFQVLVDYAHTHDALENVLNAVRTTMAAGSNSGRLICVFGCGGDRDRTKRPKMAAVAERLADHVIVTSDNPRTEDPVAIINEIRAGFSPNAHAKVLIEPDRRAAIRAAVGMAKGGDVVLIAGKGHENYQIIGTAKHHFDDVEEAAAAMIDQH